MKERMAKTATFSIEIASELAKAAKSACSAVVFDEVIAYSVSVIPFIIAKHRPGRDPAQRAPIAKATPVGRQANGSHPRARPQALWSQATDFAPRLRSLVLSLGAGRKIFDTTAFLSLDSRLSHSRKNQCLLLAFSPRSAPGRFRVAAVPPVLRLLAPRPGPSPSSWLSVSGFPRAPPARAFLRRILRRRATIEHTAPPGSGSASRVRPMEQPHSP